MNILLFRTTTSFPIRILKRVKLNDQFVLLDQSSDDDGENTANSMPMTDGRNLRRRIREILSLSRVSNNNDSSDANNYGSSNDIEMMDDDAAEFARKYFGVL